MCMRRGVYHEHVTVSLNGTATQPITLRGYPGELAVLAVAVNPGGTSVMASKWLIHTVDGSVPARRRDGPEAGAASYHPDEERP